MNDIVILGIGNTIRGDDGAGIAVARNLKKFFKKNKIDNIDVKETEEAAITLLDNLTGYKKAFIVDSIVNVRGKEGEIYRIDKELIFKKKEQYSSHQFGLRNVLELAEKMQIAMPKDIFLYAINVKKSDLFNEKLSRGVEKAVGELEKIIKKEVEKN